LGGGGGGAEVGFRGFVEDTAGCSTVCNDVFGGGGGFFGEDGQSLGGGLYLMCEEEGEEEGERAGAGDSGVVLYEFSHVGLFSEGMTE